MTDHRISPDELYKELRKQFRGQFLHLLNSKSVAFGAHIEVTMAPNVYGSNRIALHNTVQKLGYYICNFEPDNIRWVKGKEVKHCVTFDIRPTIPTNVITLEVTVANECTHDEFHSACLWCADQRRTAREIEETLRKYSIVNRQHVTVKRTKDGVQ